MVPSMMRNAGMTSIRFTPHGALLLVSDNPMTPDGVKTSASDRKVTANFARTHLEIGIDALVELANSGESVKHLKFE